MEKIYIKIAGIINLFTALLHVIVGQIDLVSPLLNSNLTTQQKGELTGAWHIVTILLFLTSYIIIRLGFKKSSNQNLQQLKSIAIFYILSGFPFIIISLLLGILAPQWILLMPIGILILIGLNKQQINE